MEIVASFNYSNGRRFLSAKRKEYTLYTNAFKINLYVAHIPMLEDMMMQRVNLKELHIMEISCLDLCKLESKTEKRRMA